MNIQLYSTKAIFLQLAPLYDNSDEIYIAELKTKNEDNFEFELEVKFPEMDQTCFIVSIQSQLSRKDTFVLQTVFLAEFKVEGHLTEDFKQSKFPYINAPAIAYPFFRSFIANTLVNSGFEVVYLPSINFEKLYHRNKDKEKSFEL